MTRFGMPRGSPKRTHTERQQSPRKSLSYAAPSDSSDSDYDSDSSAGSSPSTDSFCYASESEVPKPLPRPHHGLTDPAELQYITETVAAIRLRTRHHDPYEEWEKQTRKDAFRTARKDQITLQSQFHDKQDQIRAKQAQRLAALHAADAAQVQAQLDTMRREQQAEESKMREAWKIRDTNLWKRIDSVIKFEIDQEQSRLDAERKIREEQERKIKEEELRLKLIEEKRLQEEEKKKREEEERVRLEEEREKAEEAAEKLRLEKEGEIRKQAGLTTALDDWKVARNTLVKYKKGPLTAVKADPGMKPIWGTLRREFRTKIGQLTGDSLSIQAKSREIHSLLNPQGHLHPDVYHAALSSLAKVFLEQAETETTTSASSAEPLAQVIVNLLDTLPNFPEIFFAKLTQRVGTWAIPIYLPTVDYDGTPWASSAAKRKVMGFRDGTGSDDVPESLLEYQDRVAGMMRVYFHILKVRVQRPLEAMFETTRYWVWFARMLGSGKQTLLNPVCPELIAVALQVLGAEAKAIWGQQWIKMLEMLYDGVTTGVEGIGLLGGPSANAARGRVQIEIERIMSL